MSVSGVVVAGDLRALFSTNDRQLKAVEAFTNREQQWQAVMLAVGEHLRLLETGQLDPDKGVVRGWSSGASCNHEGLPDSWCERLPRCGHAAPS